MAGAFLVEFSLPDVMSAGSATSVAALANPHS